MTGALLLPPNSPAAPVLPAAEAEFLASPITPDTDEEMEDQQSPLRQAAALAVATAKAPSAAALPKAAALSVATEDSVEPADLLPTPAQGATACSPLQPHQPKAPPPAHLLPTLPTERPARRPHVRSSASDLKRKQWWAKQQRGHDEEGMGGSSSSAAVQSWQAAEWQATGWQAAEALQHGWQAAEAAGWQAAEAAGWQAAEWQAAGWQASGQHGWQHGQHGGWHSEGWHSEGWHPEGWQAGEWQQSSWQQDQWEHASITADVNTPMAVDMENLSDFDMEAGLDAPSSDEETWGSWTAN